MKSDPEQGNFNTHILEVMLLEVCSIPFSATVGGTVRANNSIAGDEFEAVRTGLS